MSRHYERQKERQKTPQPGQEQPDIVAGAYEDGVDRVASGSGQMVSLKKAFTLCGTGNWFDGHESEAMAGLQDRTSRARNCSTCAQGSGRRSRLVHSRKSSA